jgi:hypothetical protein
MLFIPEEGYRWRVLRGLDIPPVSFSSPQRSAKNAVQGTCLESTPPPKEDAAIKDSWQPCHIQLNDTKDPAFY